MIDKKLKALMKSRNISATDLSKETGVPRTTIQQWLTGSSPNIMQADKIASYFNVTIEELVFDRKPKPSIESIFNEAQLHVGHYRIEITKLTKKDD
jgi:transcriptional regulator with XRE-family HTH domain